MSFIDNSLVQLVLSSIVLPFIIEVGRWVINRRGYILVPKYELQAESTNWLMWYCRWWKIVIMPLTLSIISTLIAMFVSDETFETNNVVVALVCFLFVLGGIGSSEERKLFAIK